MNPHLNLFRFFNDAGQQQFIENNLSRAFAICLNNDPLFFSHYIQSIVSGEDYDYLFSVFSKDSGYCVDIQQEMSSVNIEGIRKVYAIAMTTEKMNMDDFSQQKVFQNQDRHITDVWILIKDIALVIEVKRNAADCKAQLYNQVYPFMQSASKPEILPISYSWPELIGIMEKVSTLHKLLNRQSIFVEDFLRLSERRYPEWFPSKPFGVLKFSADQSSPEYFQLMKRLKQCIMQSRYELLGYSDRLAISVPCGWANEVQPGFQAYGETIKECLAFYIWPGNTKGQGYYIYNKPMDWLQKNHLTVGEHDYDLEIDYNIKFTHFNRYVCGLTFSPDDLNGPLLHTSENFREISGQWFREQWREFETFLNEYFPAAFDWKGKCQWKENFVDSDRSYFTCSFGFEVAVFIPYAEFSIIDRRDLDVTAVAAKLSAIMDALKKLI
jgi:hypothetical protein